MTWAHAVLALDVACQVHGSCRAVQEAAWRMASVLDAPFDKSDRMPLEIRRMTGRDGTVYVDRIGVAKALPILFEVAPREVMALAVAIDQMPLRCWCATCDRMVERLEGWMDEKGIFEEHRRIGILMKLQRRNAVPSMLDVIAGQVRAWSAARRLDEVA